jgi:hypothetical protein
MEDLAIDYDVVFQNSNFKKEPMATRCAILSGFLAVPWDKPLMKAQMLDYALSFLPKFLAHQFYDDMASIYHWIGKHTNNDKKQEHKFKLVKAALETRDYWPVDKDQMLLVFGEIVDWKNENGKDFLME